MAEKTKKNKAFTKKNLLYALWVVALVAIMVTAIIIVTAVSSRKTGNMLENDDNSASEITSSGDEKTNAGTGNETSDASSENKNDENEKPDDKPTINRITFIMPCENAEVSKGYTSDTVVFNSTLGAYMGHMGIDFSAEEGAKVYCVYDGIVESVTTSYLNGTTVTVNHGNNLKTVYNSIVADESLYEGARISQGDVIGTVSANNLQEYKDGAHLHFEVIKNGSKIDPEEYLIGEEK
ncbi:MAG: M23 family metallopeptidase [Clostridia bacterium]|nr:M23 family metallopeptidase [Clostridia bacterium]